MIKRFSRNKKEAIFLAVAIILTCALRMIPFSLIARAGVEKAVYIDQSNSIGGMLDDDTDVYRSYALNILNHGLFTDYEPRRTPGYPLFLAFIYKLFGINREAVVFFQILLDIATIPLIYLLAKKICASFSVALISTLLYIAHSTFAGFFYQFYTETLFVFLLVLSTLVFFTALQKNKPSLFAFCGFIFGLGALVKPGYVSLLTFLPLCVILIRKSVFRSKVKFITSFIIPLLVPVLIWQARNAYFYGSFSLSSNTGHFLYNCCVGKAIAYTEGISFSDAKEKLKASLKEGPSNPFELNKKRQELARDYIIKHPYTYFIVSLRGIKNFFSVANTGYRYNSEWWLRIQSYLEYLFLVGGIIFVYRRKRNMLQRLYAFFVTSALIMVVLAVAARGTYRYRFPVMTLYLPLAALGITETFKIIRRKEACP